MHNRWNSCIQILEFTHLCKHRFAGISHEAERVKEYAIRHHKGKVQTFTTAGSLLTGTVTIEKALVTEFNKWIGKGACPLKRLQELAGILNTNTTLSQQPKHTQKTKKRQKDLQDQVLGCLKGKSDCEIKSLLTHEEHLMFDKAINARLVTKFIADNEQDKVSVHDVVGKSSFKISGRDVRALAGKGGEVTMYHHLDAINSELCLKNREALNFQYDQLQDLELKSAEAQALMNRLSRKVMSLQDILPGAVKDESQISEDMEELEDLRVELSS